MGPWVNGMLNDGNGMLNDGNGMLNDGERLKSAMSAVFFLMSLSIGGNSMLI